VGDWCVVMWRDCAWRGWGYSFQPFHPPPWQGRARMCTIWPTWADMERPQMMSMAIYTGHGRWSRATLWLHLMGGDFGLPLAHRLGLADTLSFAHTIFNHNFKIKISNQNFKHILKLFSRLLSQTYVYTTSDVYLTLRITLWNLFCSFREIIIYLSMALNKQYCWSIYCMIFLSNIRCSSWNSLNICSNWWQC
jgi:hypothetical protein